MLNENIRNLRKSKGLTQEELASRLHVVRQTVSKWEKGLSVPDADTLQKLADILDADVSQLLGAEIPAAESSSKVAQQLAAINEQLAIKNRRTRRVLKALGIIAIIYIAVNLLLFIVSCASVSCLTFSYTSEVETEQVEVFVSNADAGETFPSVTPEE